MEVAAALVLAKVAHDAGEDPVVAAVIAVELDGKDLAGIEPASGAGPLAKVTSLDEAVVVDAAAAPADLDTALKVADLAAWEVEAVVAVVDLDRSEGLGEGPAVDLVEDLAVAAAVVVDHAARMDSMAAAASADSANLPVGFRPSYCPRRVAAAQDLEEEGSASVLPIEDREDRLPVHQAGRLVGGHLGAEAHLPGSADHSWVDL